MPALTSDGSFSIATPLGATRLENINSSHTPGIDFGRRQNAMSGLLVDVEDELNMPGGMGFIDATDVIEKGAQGE